MHELFVYYRVRTDDAGSARAMVQRLQATLTAQHPGLTARLLRRPGPVDGQETWMETYAMDPGRTPEGVGPGLEAAIETQAESLLPLLQGARHTEVFVACAS